MTGNISVDTSEVIVTPIENKVDINVCEQSVEVSVGSSGPQGPRGSQLLSGTVNPSPVIGLVGDQYLNITTGYMFGPKTESGWGTGSELGIGLTIDEVAYTHLQTTSSNTWSIVHELDFTPNVIVVDLNGNVIEGDYQYSGNTITATFSQAITGAAYLS
jgi:hypothetical protein